MIDHILTNQPENLQAQVLTHCIADHQTISAFLMPKNNPKQKDKKETNTKPTKTLNLEETIDNIEKLPWDTINDEIEKLLRLRNDE